MTSTSAGDPLVDTNQHPVGFFATAAHCSLTLLLTVHEEPQVPFHRAVPQTRRSQPVLHPWIMFTEVQDLRFVLGQHQIFFLAKVATKQ